MNDKIKIELTMEEAASVFAALMTIARLTDDAADAGRLMTLGMRVSHVVRNARAMEEERTVMH